MSSTTEELLDIEYWTSTCFSIRCDCCDGLARDFGESKQQAVLGFHEDGWRDISGNMLCPECVKRINQ